MKYRGASSEPIPNFNIENKLPYNKLPWSSKYKWDHFKNIQKHSKPWFSTKSRLCCVSRFPRVEKNDEWCRCARSGRPLSGASPRSHWHENKSHFTIPQHFTYRSIIDNDLSLQLTKVWSLKFLCSKSIWNFICVRSTRNLIKWPRSVQNDLGHSGHSKLKKSGHSKCYIVRYISILQRWNSTDFLASFFNDITL